MLEGMDSFVLCKSGVGICSTFTASNLQSKHGKMQISGPRFLYTDVSETADPISRFPSEDRSIVSAQGS